MIIGEPFLDAYGNYTGYDSFVKRKKNAKTKAKPARRRPLKRLATNVRTRVAQRKQNIANNFGMMRRRMAAMPVQPGMDNSPMDDAPDQVDNSIVDNTLQPDQDNSAQPVADDSDAAPSDNDEQGFDSFDDTPQKHKHHWFSWLRRKKHPDGTGNPSNNNATNTADQSSDQSAGANTDTVQDNNSDATAGQSTDPTQAARQQKPGATTRPKTSAGPSKQQKPTANTKAKAPSQNAGKPANTNSNKQSPAANTNSKQKAPASKTTPQDKKQDKPADPAQNAPADNQPKSDNTVAIIAGVGLTLLVAGVAIYAAKSASKAKKEIFIQHGLNP